MTTTDPDGAQSASGGQSRSGAVGPNSHDVHSGCDRHSTRDVVGSNVADPAQPSGVRQSARGGVGDPSTVNAQGFRESQDRIGVDGPSSHDAQAPDECHPGFGIVGPTPTDPPRDNAWAIPLPAGSSALTPPGTPMPSASATRGSACPGLSAPTEPPNASTTARKSSEAPSAPTPPGALMGRPSATAVLACPEAQTPPAAPKVASSTNRRAAPLADPFLALAADVLDDLERVRIANENRLRQLTRTATDSDGEERGFGLDETHPDVARLAALVDALGKNEHQATLNLARQMRAHPLGAWVKRTAGIGEKQAARLLASIGDPSWNDLHDRPRTLRELYSYCGYGDAAAQVRRRGEKANWDATGKMRAHLVAVSCVKATKSPYRAVYDDGRAKYADALHPAECKRCGPAGKPAQPGTPLSAGHQHARALRLVAKAILRDLWREARRIHGYTDDEEQAA